MFDDNPQLRHPIADLNDTRQNGKSTDDIDFEPGLSEQFEVCNRLWLAEVFAKISIPQVSDADAVESPALQEALQAVSESGLANFDVATGAQDDRITRRQIKHPLVVFKQRAGLDFNHALDAQ